MRLPVVSCNPSAFAARVDDCCSGKPSNRTGVRNEDYLDAFGNHWGRVNAPAGTIWFFSRVVVRDSGEPDAYAPEAEAYGLHEVPKEIYLLFYRVATARLTANYWILPGKDLA